MRVVHVTSVYLVAARLSRHEKLQFTDIFNITVSHLFGLRMSDSMRKEPTCKSTADRLPAAVLETLMAGKTDWCDVHYLQDMVNLM